VIVQSARSAAATSSSFTGQRLREVAEARWSEIDLDQALWTIPHHRMKGDAAHEIPLAPVAAAIFKSLPRFSGPYVFTTQDGSRPVSGFGKVKDRINTTICELSCNPASIGDWRLHDLRRTMRTHLSGLPVPDMVRELVIAHKKPGLHRVYDQHTLTATKNATRLSFGKSGCSRS
jgi:integrase